MGEEHVGVIYVVINLYLKTVCSFVNSKGGDYLLIP